METNKENVNSTYKQLMTHFEGVKIFALKAGIILIGIFILANFLLPDSSKFEHKLEYQLYKLRENLRRFETPMSKLILASFVQNPRALLRISEIEESEGKIDNAIRETDLAIGLLEMHGANKQVIQKYSDRLDKLKSKKLNTPITSAQNK